MNAFRDDDVRFCEIGGGGLALRRMSPECPMSASNQNTTAFNAPSFATGTETWKSSSHDAAPFSARFFARALESERASEVPSVRRFASSFASPFAECSAAAFARSRACRSSSNTSNASDSTTCGSRRGSKRAVCGCHL